MSRIQSIESLKSKIEELKTERDRASGALSNILTQLQDNHDLRDLDAAEALLVKLQKQECKAKTAFTTALEEFEDEFADLLD